MGRLSKAKIDTDTKTEKKGLSAKRGGSNGGG